MRILDDRRAAGSGLGRFGSAAMRGAFLQGYRFGSFGMSGLFSTIDLADIEWLVSPAAEKWLQEAAQAEHSALAAATRLRRELSPQRAALALEQVELRRRGQEKFPAAERMFFSRQALEQATDHWIARYKASRLASDASEALRIDLCAGIGGDALALAERGSTLAVERNGPLARLAQANAAACGVGERLRVVCDDVAHVDPAAARGNVLHVDPDRRARGHRTSAAAFSDPPPEALARWLEEAEAAAVKLAPSAEIPGAWRAAEREWISRGGVCRQQVAWMGRAAPLPGRRRATRVEPAGAATLVSDDESVEADRAALWRRYLHEPDPAVIAAGLVAALARQRQMQRIDERLVYLTSDAPSDTPLAASFEILETLPFDLRRVKRALDARRWGRLEIKARGAFDRPEELARRLRVEGEERGTILLARAGGAMTAILARRYTPQDT